MDQNTMIEAGKATKNKHEEIRLTLAVFQGRLHGDLRVYRKADGSSDMRATAKGITFKADLLEDLIGLLQQGRNRVETYSDPKSL